MERGGATYVDRWPAGIGAAVAELEHLQRLGVDDERVAETEEVAACLTWDVRAAVVSTTRGDAVRATVLPPPCNTSDRRLPPPDRVPQPPVPMATVMPMPMANAIPYPMPRASVVANPPPMPMQPMPMSNVAVTHCRCEWQWIGL